MSMCSYGYVSGTKFYYLMIILQFIKNYNV